MTRPATYAQQALDVLVDLVQDERVAVDARIEAAGLLLRYWPLAETEPASGPHGTPPPTTIKQSCPECRSDNVEVELDPALRCRACGHAWIAGEAN